jgi:hypothetical protein
MRRLSPSVFVVVPKERSGVSIPRRIAMYSLLK